MSTFSASFRILFANLSVVLCSWTGYPTLSQAQDNTHNYILTRTYKVPLKDAAVPVSVGEAMLSLGYFDGLGRLQQTVNVQAGKNKGDLVAPIEYDALGRLSKTYLPVNTATQTGTFQPSAAALSTAYYNNATRFAEPTTHVYTESQYEASPLNRSTGQISAGTTAATSRTYEVNDMTVRNYRAGAGLTDITRNGFYGPRQLTVTQSADEEGKLLAEFKDKDGRLILRQAASGQDKTSTYYVYDDLNQLRAVIQPLYDGLTSPTTTDLTSNAFLYLYDGRGRLIQKRIPAGGLTQMQYNTSRDLLISSTDAKNQQFYYNYDALNRQIEMGICLGTCDPASPANTTNKTPLQYTYYDHYETTIPLNNAKLGDGPFGFSNLYGLTIGSDFVPTDMRNANRKGQVTGQCVRFLNADGSLSSLWNCSATYYDDRYRVVQTVRNLPLGTNGLERVSYKRDFSGKTLLQKTTQSWGSQSNSVEQLLSYDHAERLTATRYVVSSSDATLNKDVYVHTLAYNEVGQLVDKYLNASKSDGTGAVEHLTYKYNVRGWLREHKGVAQSSRSYQLLLGYQNNGNISSLGWQYPTAVNTGTYQFGYDGLNRLVSGRTGSGTGQGETINYDLNGNISTLNRYDPTCGQIDALTYSYWGDNRLRAVGDATNNPAGFNNGYTGDDYSYDLNGNITADYNRGITNVDYNYLNLPRRISMPGKTMDYVYDAGGQKHSMTVGGVTTSYEGLFEYDGGGLPTRILTEEGQLVKDNGNWKWQYYLRDHLGNVRVVLDETGSVVQEMDYYPFGLAIPKSPSDLTSSRAKNKYLYLNRELQAENKWLDLKARYYDPAIGRFLTVDPLTESQEHLSPYHYGYDNPMRFSDPDGLASRDALGNVTFNGYVGMGEGGIFSGSTENDKGPGKGKTTSDANGKSKSIPSSRYDSFSNEIVPELQAGLKETFKNVVELFDLANGTNLSGINSNPGQRYVGGGVPSLGIKVISGAKIATLIEANAGRQLSATEAATSGAHFLSRHGAGTTLAQQEVRALTCLTPDGLLRRPVDASRFLSNQVQLQAAQRAQTIFNQTGQNVINFNMGFQVGEGYLKGGGNVISSSNVQAIFRGGSLYTIFPKLR